VSLYQAALQPREKKKAVADVPGKKKGQRVATKRRKTADFSDREASTEGEVLYGGRKGKHPPKKGAATDFAKKKKCCLACPEGTGKETKIRRDPSD